MNTTSAQLIMKEAKRSAGLIGQAVAALAGTQQLVAFNGRYYHVAITGIKRTANITDSENAGRTKPPVAEMIRDVIGTFISYTLTLEVKEGDVETYDDLYLTIIQPVASIPVSMPFGQGRLEFDAYVTKVTDELKANKKGVLLWGGLQLECTPMRAQLRPA